MAENSKIEWTTHTFNPWRGCTKISAGCTNCYAETLSHRNPKTLGVWGPNGTRVIAAESAWRQPLKWDKAAQAAGERHRVFCASLADVFEDREELVEPRRRLFRLIDDTPNLDWLLLTKRPENFAKMLPAVGFPDAGVPGTLGRRLQLPNVWLGVSVENQAAADERIPHLLKTPAAVRFLSCEPLLGPVVLDAGRTQSRHDGWDWLGGWKAAAVAGPEYPEGANTERIDWVIVGGESGPGARPCQVAWVRSVVEQCRAANVSVFVKQLGANPEGDDFPERRDPETGNRILEVRQVLTIRDRKGGDMTEFPADLQVREFPESES